MKETEHSRTSMRWDGFLVCKVALSADLATNVRGLLHSWFEAEIIHEQLLLAQLTVLKALTYCPGKTRHRVHVHHIL